MPSRFSLLALFVALPVLVAGEELGADGTRGAHRGPVAISDLRAGRLLLEAGEWSRARMLLERARPANEEEGIERLFLLGSAEVRLGRLRDAARRFEEILALRPDLTRVRIELARVYQALGHDGKARYHFESSLADKLPSSVEHAVERWLDRIDARRRWSVSLSVAALPESNPVRRTGREEVRIGGVPFRLNEDAREASGTGFLLSTGAQYSPVLSGDWRGVLAVSPAVKLYEQSDRNDISVQGDAGIARLFDRGSASGGIRLSRRWLGGQHYSTGIGPWARGRLRPMPALRLDAALGAARREHPERRGLDGWTVTLRPRLDYAFSARTALRLEIDLEHIGARENRLGSRLGGLAVSLSHALQGALSVSPRISVSRRLYAGKDPLFRKTRSDTHARVSVNLLHRALQYRGIAPYLGVFHEWNRSNIPINTWRNHGAALGISTTF